MEHPPIFTPELKAKLMETSLHIMKMIDLLEAKKAGDELETILGCLQDSTEELKRIIAGFHVSED